MELLEHAPNYILAKLHKKIGKSLQKSGYRFIICSKIHVHIAQLVFLRSKFGRCVRLTQQIQGDKQWIVPMYLLRSAAKLRQGQGRRTSSSAEGKEGTGSMAWLIY